MGLRQQAKTGVVWTSIGTIGYGLANLAVNIVLARLLTPHDFGIIELLIVFSGISDIIVDSGFSQAIIRDNKATKRDLSSVFFVNVAIALFLYAVLFLLSPNIAGFYDEPIMEKLSRLVFLTIIFNSFSVIQNANFSRELNFKPYAIASISGILISGGISIYLAVKGLGVWALAINITLLSFIRMSILWFMSKWRPSLEFCFESVRKYFSFGINLMFQGLLDKVVTNLESLVIGKVYVKQELGYFSQGRKLDSYVIQTSTNVIQKVTYPLLSKISDDANRLKEGYRDILGVTMCCITPIIVVMFFGADIIMAGIFGDQWLPAAKFLRLWAICGWLVSLYSIFINVFLVKGKSSLLLKCSIVKQILRIIVIFTLIKISIMHMMIGIIMVTLISAIIYIYFAGRLIDYSIFRVLKDIVPIVVCSIIAGTISSLVTTRLIPFKGVLALAVFLIIVFLIYTGLLLLSKNKDFKFVISVLKRR